MQLADRQHGAFFVTHERKEKHEKIKQVRKDKHRELGLQVSENLWHSRSVRSSLRHYLIRQYISKLE
jgi:hypothetical protein